MKIKIIATSIISFCILLLNSQTISTYAGNGITGSLNDSSMKATFNYPVGVCMDASKNIYVADFYNHLIRKISPTGIVSTFAGSGLSGDQDGNGINASFNNPKGICIDTQGNIYVADQGNNKIRKITSAGIVSTFAGSGNPGTKNGQGGAAEFQGPYGLFYSKSGAIYVADEDNHLIRRITLTGGVTTFAGSGVAGKKDGQGAVAEFFEPHQICEDNSGNFYVTDYKNNIIRKITPTGLVSTFVGNGIQKNMDGQGVNSSFEGPVGICFDGTSNLYVADFLGHKIRKIDLNGKVSTFAGNGSIGSQNSNLLQSSFNYPVDFVYDKNAGNMYISEAHGNKIRRIKFSTSNIENSEDKFEFLLSPNPATNISVISGFSNERSTLNIEIYNLKGQLCQTYKKLALGEYSIPLDIAELTNGIYKVVLKDNNSILNEAKLQIEK